MRYIADEDIIAAVLNAIEKIKENPQILSRDEEESSYFRTNEIMRYTNEISRITNSLNPSFNTGKKLIFECANLKFLACREIYNVFIYVLARIQSGGKRKKRRLVRL